MSLKVTSHGAASDIVTGSAHVVELDGARFLIDLGLFQGAKEISELNAAPLEFDARSLDAVLLTHGHLDHCGRLPLLVQQGFQGKIYTTTASRDVARLILIDSARVQGEDYRRQRGRIKGEAAIPPPLYTEQDVFETLDLIETVRLDEPFLVSGVKVCFGHAGHILGSAYIELTGRDHRFVASGDIGHWGPHVVPDPALPSRADVILVETTYGDTIHPPMEEATEKLADLIHRVTREGGNLLVPSFALERTQDVLHQLLLARDKRRLPRNLKVFLDSPLGIRFTQLYRRYPEQLSETVKSYIMQSRSPFRWDDVHFTISSQESKDIRRHQRGVVIMAGSGMASGGRILNHLKDHLERPESAVVFVGFQAEGTLGRMLVEGVKSVTIDGEEFQVRAGIHEIDGFSAHADQEGIIRWVTATGKPHVLLAHGEGEAPIAVQNRLSEQHGIDSTISQMGETYEF